MKIYSYPYKKHSENSDREIISSVKAYLDNPNASVTVIRDSYGKPHIVGTDGIYVSVSHAEKLLLVAVAPFEIGIDAENKERRVKNPSALARRYFCEDEIDFLGENPTEATFTDMWVKKEALSKLLGKGVPAMREMSVFSERVILKRQTVYSGYVVYTAEWK